MDKLFDTKRRYTDFDDEEYINMSIPVVNIDEISGNRIDKLTVDDNGRLDRFVWKRISKNLDMIDVVMYANHIFNPFSVKDGDMLYVPVDSNKVYSSSNEPTLPDGSKYSKKSKGKKEMTYAEKIEYLAKKGLGIK